jgi:Fe-S-cluster containining protein
MERTRNFVCTKCGACCDRSPELLLSETFDLADVFVFRLMFRLYEQPSSPLAESDRRNPIAFYGQKRLLNAFAAKKWHGKRDYSGKKASVTSYLLISAIKHDLGFGRWHALVEKHCSIHDRRPLGCKTVPLHYSKPESLLSVEFDRFIKTNGYECDSSESAPVLFEDQRIVQADLLAARSCALGVASADSRWAKMIAKHIPLTPDENTPLPSLQQIERHSHLGALTCSMLVAWEYASDLGIISRAKCNDLYSAQITSIDNLISSTPANTANWKMLDLMRREYLQALT